MKIGPVRRRNAWAACVAGAAVLALVAGCGGETDGDGDGSDGEGNFSGPGTSGSSQIDHGPQCDAMCDRFFDVCATPTGGCMNSCSGGADASAACGPEYADVLDCFINAPIACDDDATALIAGCDGVFATWSNCVDASKNGGGSDEGGGEEGGEEGFGDDGGGEEGFGDDGFGDDGD